MASLITLVPNASILMNSMRSIGYDFETAIADIIDNSISADSNRIDILFPTGDYDEKYIAIVDNGFGMNRSELIEAMRFGSVKCEKRLDNDLGRFGLGLKTASLSQCRKFTVISKKKSSHINGFYWDIDSLGIEKNWDLFELNKDELLTQIFDISPYINYDSFTIVLWEKIDSLDRDVNQLNTITDIFLRKISNMENHISLVFHRFLGNKLSIYLNGNIVTPFDPFLLNHPKTDSKVPEIINTKTSKGQDEKVVIQVCILPYYKDLSKEDLIKIGDDNPAENQGFYIYRNKRLMIYGTWFRIKPRTELSRNARILVDIPNTLDDQWSIDIKKQKAVIPGTLLEQLRKEIGEAVEKSKKIYEYQGTAQISNGALWQKFTDQRNKEVNYKINHESDLIKDILEDLNDKEKNKIVKLFQMIELALPYKDIYNSVAEKKEINSISNDLLDLVIEQAFGLYYDIKKKRSMDRDSIINYICSLEPFKSANIKEKLKEQVHE